MSPDATDPARSGAAPLRGPQHDPRAAAPKPADPQAGAAFRALLDRLAERAEELSRDADGVADPQRLAGAVDRARESLADALTLGDRLIEAVREANHQRRAGREDTGAEDIRSEQSS